MGKRVFIVILIMSFLMGAISSVFGSTGSVYVDFTFDEADGTGLVDISKLWSYQGDSASAKIVNDGENGYMKFMAEDKLYRATFNAASYNITDSYTIQTRVKLCTSAYKVIRIQYANNGTDTDILSLVTTVDNMGVPILYDSINGKENVLLRYRSDLDVQQADADWHTYWFTYNAAGENYDGYH